MAEIPPSPSPEPSPEKPSIEKPSEGKPTPAIPPYPPYGSKMTRRQFFSWFTLAWASFTLATLGALSLVLRYMFPNVLFEPRMWFKAGFPDDYEIGVDERWKEKFGVWIVKTGEGMVALLSVCTHLGCTPNWLSNENKFKCPCHGSGFYSSGINFEGPAPRPLERVRIGRAEDGQILVDKSKKYQQEKGEWNDPESFLAL